MGGGPAGLAAAVFAARAGARVRLFERNDQCGKKLLATGGGHCNAANALPPGRWPALFGKRGRFIVPALEAMPTDALLAWFAALGQPLVRRDGGQYFPESNSARQVRDALVAEAVRHGVRIEASRRVGGVRVDAGAVAAVETAAGLEACDVLVVTGGGAGFPATGSTFDGAALAERTGHRVSAPVPGLVGLRTPDLDAGLAGLVIPDAFVLYRQKGVAAAVYAGELLLTHAGVSGPAVLDVSAAVAAALAAGCEPLLRLRWRGGDDTAAWRRRLDVWRGTAGGTPLAALLKEYMPGRLARWLCDRSGVGEGTAAALPGAARDRLSENLGGYAVRIAGTEGWDKAMITRGGVDVRDIDPKTMASRLVEGLYFAGEVVDVDGPCGGFNLHWAFASGALAGSAAGRG
jgi:predicted Rossmann fold flavoprotein